MSESINEIKAKVYDELVKKTVAERNINILEQQLQKLIQEEMAQEATKSSAGPQLVSQPLEALPHNNS